MKGLVIGGMLLGLVLSYALIGGVNPAHDSSLGNAMVVMSFLMGPLVLLFPIAIMAACTMLGGGVGYLVTICVAAMSATTPAAKGSNARDLAQEGVGLVEDVGPWSQYAKQWNEALEHFVSTHYPEELRGNFIGGGTVVVTMNNSGLERSSSVSVPVRIAQSSGVRSVDDAAVKLILDPAIPWPKFPPELATKFKIAIVKRKFDFTADE